MHSDHSSRHPEEEGRPVIEQEIDFSDKKHHLLACPKCNHFISGVDINVEKTLAKCGHCQHMFNFEHDSETQTLKPATHRRAS